MTISTAMFWRRNQREQSSAACHLTLRSPSFLLTGKKSICSIYSERKIYGALLPSQVIAIPTMQIVPSSREFRIQLMSLEKRQRLVE